MKMEAQPKSTKKEIADKYIVLESMKDVDHFMKSLENSIFRFFRLGWSYMPW